MKRQTQDLIALFFSFFLIIGGIIAPAFLLRIVFVVSGMVTAIFLVREKNKIQRPNKM